MIYFYFKLPEKISSFLHKPIINVSEAGPKIFGSVSERVKMPPKKAGGRAKKTASGYRMPDHLDPGTILTDLNKKQVRCLDLLIFLGDFSPPVYLRKISIFGRKKLSLKDKTLLSFN